MPRDGVADNLLRTLRGVGFRARIRSQGSGVEKT